LRLTEQYRGAMWPILTGLESGLTRLRLALLALCGVAERNLPLLIATDTIFHEAHILTRADFTEPLEQFLREGMREGSINARDVAETASLLFNSVCWTYTHLRAHHHWEAGRAQTLVVNLVLEGVGLH